MSEDERDRTETVPGRDLDEVDDDHLEGLVITDHVLVIELPAACHNLDAQAVAMRKAALLRVAARNSSLLMLSMAIKSIEASGSFGKKAAASLFSAKRFQGQTSWQSSQP